MLVYLFFFFFFFNDTATTEIYTLSLHDALPICWPASWKMPFCTCAPTSWTLAQDRKSTRLNSSHITISYAVFCLKKKKTNKKNIAHTHTTPITYIQPSTNHMIVLVVCLWVCLRRCDLFLLVFLF